ERSLDLSCPEAARLALTNPGRMEFKTRLGDGDSSRLGSVGLADTTNAKDPGKPYRYVREVRALMIALLQNRGYSLPDRIRVLGRVCGKLDAEGTEDGWSELRDLSREAA